VYGWIENIYVQKNMRRQPVEMRTNQSTLALLRDQLPSDELARFCAEGARMSEEEVCRLALL
jgi:hypothetical protein